MAAVLFDIKVMTADLFRMIRDMQQTLEPRRMAIGLSTRLRREFQQQVEQSVSEQGAAGGDSWPSLSAWSIRDRGNTGPMLIRSGSLVDEELLRYRGVVRLIAAGFSFNFPDTKEMTPHAWGILAGQLVNPLGATPLALTPRRVLGGTARQQSESILALTQYFRAEGWDVQIG